MRIRTAILATLLVSTALASAAQAGVRDERRTLVGGEVLGRGLFLTFNLEHFLTSTFGLGAGILAAGNSDGGFAIVPLYVSIVPGDVHSLYLGAGVTFATGVDFDDAETEAVLTLTAGYQYHSYGGLWLRPTFSLLTVNDSDSSTVIWPGFAIGGSF